ncbi:caspase family protein [Streptomyces sp. 110]|uniref:Caspase family protein n=1 Tax=Streptomyces endocoffeicus TaxID=2898945 RepID=A0ABS1Q7R7_9ACTN|nr:caspase family protein [Streptomyces endocoffeicus]MBL1120384.1 caspase family protein [Streptomyces endocoffeicus]
MAPEGDDIAILIGVSQYQDPSLPNVPAVLNSLHTMRRLLTDPDLCGWAESQVHVLEDPVGSSELALRLHRLAEKTTGTLLVYFVGHGVLTKTGALCLATSDTQLRYPDLTGLEYDKVRSALLGSPAQVKLVILDCCYSGRAINGLAGSDQSHFAAAAEISGVYTLTAADQVAHVPSPEAQKIACTSFTGALNDVVRSGIPNAPALLSLSDIYPKLKHVLRVRNLPEPNQRATDTATFYPFSRNVAYAGGTGFRLIPREREDLFVKILAAQPHHNLTIPNIERLDDWPGVYLLHQAAGTRIPEIVYVGKGDRSIPHRLKRHLQKIDGRCNIDSGDFTFSYLKLDDDLSYVAPEHLVLRQLHGRGAAAWNNNGFGNQDPGRMRDRTRLRSHHFDALYPIDLSWKLRTEGSALDLTAYELAVQLQQKLPYNFRFEHRGGAFNDETLVSVPEGPLSADQAFRLLSAAMGDKWQISALMGYVLMYREQAITYPSAIRYYVSGQAMGAIPDVYEEDIVDYGP